MSIPAVFMIVPILFEGYAYVHCFRSFGRLDVVTLVSAVFATIVLLQALVYWVAAQGLSDSY